MREIAIPSKDAGDVRTSVAGLTTSERIKGTATEFLDDRNSHAREKMMQPSESVLTRRNWHAQNFAALNFTSNMGAGVETVTIS